MKPSSGRRFTRNMRPVIKESLANNMKSLFKIANMNTCFPLIVLMLLISTKALTQGNNTRANWNLRIKQALHMKDNEFNSFIKGTEKYDIRINDIMRDST